MKNRPTYGLWKFYNDFEDHPRTVWCNDNSWCAEALFTMYRHDGRQDYLKRALATSEAFYRLGMEKKICISGGELNGMGFEEFVKEYAWIDTPNSYVPILYLHAYCATGESRYLAKAEEVSSSLRTTESCTHSDIFDIYMMAVLYRITGRQEYRDRLDRLVGIIKKNQLSCGAIRNFLNNEKATRTKYGRLEVGVMHKGNEPIADMLYINAPLVFSMYTAYMLTGDEEYKKVFHGIADFMVRAQIKSSDRRLDGAWMRAFDYSRWDYYGSNGDVDWGPYCVESGWTNSWIAKTFALYLLKETDIACK